MSHDFTAAPSAQKLSVGTASPSQLGAATSLRPDEERFLAAGGRCEACGHLSALHNTHCCEFCTMPGCRCKCGEVAPMGPDPKPEPRAPIDPSQIGFQVTRIYGKTLADNVAPSNALLAQLRRFP